MTTPTLRSALEHLIKASHWRSAALCGYDNDKIRDADSRFQHALENAEAALAALASHVEQEPVAWIEFADNGNIRFWTSDPARAWTEGENGRPLRKFTLAEFVALAAREKAAAIAKLGER